MGDVFAAAYHDTDTTPDTILAYASAHGLTIVDYIHTPADLTAGAKRKAWVAVIADTPEIFVREGRNGMKAIQRLHHAGIAVLFASTPDGISDRDAALDTMVAAMMRWYEGREIE